MGKAFIELKYRQRKFKLNADDIARVYRIAKRKIPALPSFHEPIKTLVETDDDCELPLELQV
jgi:hypothetical protein